MSARAISVLPRGPYVTRVGLGLDMFRVHDGSGWVTRTNPCLLTVISVKFELAYFKAPHNSQ